MKAGKISHRIFHFLFPIGWFLLLLSFCSQGVTDTVRASVDSLWGQLDRDSWLERVSADGRFILFAATSFSEANCKWFLRDQVTQSTELIHASPLGQYNPCGGQADLSDDGRFVVFASNALGLPDAVAGIHSVYLKDRVDETLVRVSRGLAGGQPNSGAWASSISADGRFILYLSDASNIVEADTNGVTDMFLYDRLTQLTERVSVTGINTQANGAVPWYSSGISADGRFITFLSFATNLVENDTNEKIDVFLRDRWWLRTTRVSQTQGGEQANQDTYNTHISGDGRFIAFSSAATNLVSVDENQSDDCFVHNRVSGETTRINISLQGKPADSWCDAPRLNYDGRYICFVSPASNLSLLGGGGRVDVFVHDRWTGYHHLVNLDPAGGTANGSSYGCDISDNGWVAFHSRASDLVTGDTNNAADVFIRQLGLNTRLNSNNSATGNVVGPGVTAYGRYYVYASDAPDIVVDDNNGFSDIFLVDLITETTKRISVHPGQIWWEANNHSAEQVVSMDGQFIAFTTLADNLSPQVDDNNRQDVLLYDREGDRMVLISATPDGAVGNEMSHTPSISDNGGIVSFSSAASDLLDSDPNGHTDIFLYDRTTGSTMSPTAWGGVMLNGYVPSNGPSSSPAISGDGRYLAYASSASNLIVGDTEGYIDIFLYDVSTGTNARISTAPDGTGGDGASLTPSISRDGRYIAYESMATNLTGSNFPDPVGVTDIFVFDRLTGVTVSPTNNYFPRGGEQFTLMEPYANSHSRNAHISRDGRFVTFDSQASNLIVGDNNGHKDIFVWDRGVGINYLASLAPDGRQSTNTSMHPVLSQNGRFLTMRSLATNLEYNSGYLIFELEAKWDLFVSLIGHPPIGYCSGDKVQIENHVFAAGSLTSCLAATSIEAGALTSWTGIYAEPGAKLELRAPVVRLRPGFKIATGAELTVGTP